tara:strand:+ start:1316 stop:1714 length:399 start_codon:yes stop_codon:yes gene_type:complete
MIITSNKATLTAKQSNTYSFISNFSNFEKLLPKERVIVKDISSENIVFEIKGMATIGMTVIERQNDKLVVAESSGKNPFPFKLSIFVTETDLGSEAYLEFDGEVNSFLKLMVETPLTNFFNSLVSELEKQAL